MICATVGGKPMTYGNKSPGRTKDGRLFVREQNASQVRSWQDAMRRSMKAALHEHGLTEPPWERGRAVRVLVTIYLVRPKSHYRKDGSLTKLGIEALPTAKPDGDKVVRCALDCAKGIWWWDDSQATDGRWIKRWSDSFARTDIEASDAG